MPARWVAVLNRRWLQAVLLVVLGMGYRLTFIRQGLNGIDEGWLQSMGARIVDGQLPYRDFHYTYGPVAIYLQAFFIHTFGDGYTLLASRLVLAGEATLGSLLAWVVMRRYVTPLRAFLFAIPTVFFTIILFYFASYTYDAVLFAMASAALWTARRRYPIAVAALTGSAVVLAASAKPQFIILLGVYPLADVLDRRPLIGRAGVLAAAGAMVVGAMVTAIAVSAPFAAGHALQQYLHDSIFASHEARPEPLSFVFWQDIPTVLAADDHAVMLAVIGVVLLACVWVSLPVLRWTPVLAAGLLASLAILGTGANSGVSMTMGQAHIIYVGLCVLLVINALMLVFLTLRSFLGASFLGPADDGLRPSLPLVALAIQYLAQYNYAGIANGYIGTFLSLPSALAFLAMAGRRKGIGLGPLRASVPRLGALALGLWFGVAGFIVTRSFTYVEGPRADLVVPVQGHKLDGILTTDSTASHTQATLDLIDRKTRPGDPILVLPDWSILYYLSDRTDPTKLTWYDAGLVTPVQVEEAAADLHRNPARLIIFENFDFVSSDPLYAPLMSVILAEYVRTNEPGTYAIYEPVRSR